MSRSLVAFELYFSAFEDHPVCFAEVSHSKHEFTKDLKGQKEEEEEAEEVCPPGIRCRNGSFSQLLESLEAVYAQDVDRSGCQSGVAEAVELCLQLSVSMERQGRSLDGGRPAGDLKKEKALVPSAPCQNALLLPSDPGTLATHVPSIRGLHIQSQRDHCEVYDNNHQKPSIFNNCNLMSSNEVLISRGTPVDVVA